MKNKMIDMAESLFMSGVSVLIRKKCEYLPYEWKKGTYFTPRRVILKKMEKWQFNAKHNRLSESAINDTSWIQKNNLPQLQTFRTSLEQAEKKSIREKAMSRRGSTLRLISKQGAKI